MRRYRGIARAAQKARERKIEAEGQRRDEKMDPAEMTRDDLHSAIYRLQSRNRQGVFAERIRELVAELGRRSR